MILDVQFDSARWSWPELRDKTLEAEADGYGTVWVLDHLSGKVFGGDRMLECWSLAGALAVATTRIGIGTLVANAANRPPAVTAVAAASIQEISGGRFSFGVGAGAAPGSRWADEHTVAGIGLGSTMEDRHARLVEVLDTCAAMWSPDRDASWDGFPLPTPPPPVFLGVNSEALAELAGRRADGVNVRSDHPRLESILAAADRARPCRQRPFSMSVWAPWDPGLADPAHPKRQRWASLGVDRLIVVR